MTKFNRVDQLTFQLLIPIFIISVQLLGIQKTVHILVRLNKDRLPITDDNLDNARILVRSMKMAVQKTLWKGNCLSRSLALFWMLKRRGVTAEFYIGVKNKPRFRAHAWVEHKGVPLNAGKKVRTRYQIVKELNMSRDTFL